MSTASETSTTSMEGVGEAGDGFLRALDAQVEAAVKALGERSAACEPGPGVDLKALLATALRNELEASQEAALWMTLESDVEVKLALARQCGDEAKHYRLIAARLAELGVDPSKVDPLAGGVSPMYAHLASLTSTVERIAAGPYAREAVACVRNEVFIAYCEAHGDPVTAALYRDVILPDERHHHGLGRSLLARLARTDEERALAQRAVEKTLALADELQELARLKKGIAQAPGC